MPFLLVALLVPILPLELPNVAEPPMPDFKTRVDYVQWYKDQLKFAEQDNAYQEYSRFMRASRQPQAPEAVSSQMDELLKSPSPWRPRLCLTTIVLRLCRSLCAPAVRQDCRNGFRPGRIRDADRYRDWVVRQSLIGFQDWPDG